MDNEPQATTFRNGEIFGIRNVLKRIEAKANDKYNPGNDHLARTLRELIKEVNEFPTIQESGKFYIDPETKLVAFRYEKNS